MLTVYHQTAMYIGDIPLVSGVFVLFSVLPVVEPGSAIPTPRSSLVDRFVEQTDGLYGYRILRPANWTPGGGGLPQGRFYFAPGFQGPQQGIGVTIVNLTLVAASEGPNGANAQWLLFQRDPSLAGWTAGIEGAWTRDGWSFTLLRTLPQAKLYAITPSGNLAIVNLVAYAIDHGQPLILGLQAGGTYADIGRLEAQGIVDDFAVMAGSITAIPPDPENVAPALPTPAPSQPRPTIPAPSVSPQ